MSVYHHLQCLLKRCLYLFRCFVVDAGIAFAAVACVVVYVNAGDIDEHAVVNVFVAVGAIL